MSSNVAKDIYDLNKNYVEVTFSQKRPPLDFEFNELQKIQSGLRHQFNKAALLDGPSGDGFFVEGTGNPNEIRVRSGLLVQNGINLYLPEDLIIDTLTTPVGSDRQDVVYLEWNIREVDAGEDLTIVDSFNVGFETATRQKLDVQIYVTEGGFVPSPAVGYTQYRLALLNRQDGINILDATNIVDQRYISALNYVSTGGKVLHVSGFQFSFEGASGLVAGNVFALPNSVSSIGANETRYLYVPENELLTLAASLPTTYHVPLAKITSDALGIIDIVDLRRFSPMAASNSNNSQTILTLTALVPIDAFQLVRVTGVNTVNLANAATEATVPTWGIALDDATAGESLRVLTTGMVENTDWNFVAGSQLYLGSTAGGIAAVAPSVLGSVIQKVGVALTPTQIYFNPDLTYDVVGGVSSHAQNTDIGTTGSSFTLRLGQGSMTAPAGFYVEKGVGADPGIRFNHTSETWEFSNDGTNWSSLGVLNTPFRYNTIGDGASTVFNMPVGKVFIPDGEHLLVFAGTTLMLPGSDYTETSHSQVTFSSPPLLGQALSFVCFSV